MSLLSYTQLCALADLGVITDTPRERINSSSIDLTLGDMLLVEDNDIERDTHLVSLKARDKLKTNEWHFGDDDTPFFLKPGQFVLGQTQQQFHLPLNISSEYKLKSSMARIGLEHLNAGWCDAGWNGSVLTLEIKNLTQNHIIVLNRGVGIGQMVFFQHEDVPASKSYASRGRYNGDKTVSGIKV